MREIIQEQFHNHFNKILAVSRYKALGYSIVGIGYPFFRNEYKFFIEMCDFFIDSDTNPLTNHWTQTYNTKELSFLKNIDKFIILLLSKNRYSELVQIKELYPDVIVIVVDKNENENEVLCSINDVYESKLLLYKSIKNGNINILGALTVTGKSTIEQTSAGELDLRSVEFRSNSAIYNRSRHKNYIDALYLCNSSYLLLGLDSQLFIRNCYINKNTKIHLYSGKINMEDVYIGENCILHVYDELYIGNNTIISWNVTIIDGDGHSLISDNKKNIPQGIHIGSNVWIGSNVTILKGVKIGEGSVIGAGSVVTQSIPSNSVAVGNPARVIRKDIQWKYDYNY